LFIAAITGTSSEEISLGAWGDSYRHKRPTTAYGVGRAAAFVFPAMLRDMQDSPGKDTMNAIKKM
jgi:hypothetical protein